MDILSACADAGSRPGYPSWVPNLQQAWGEDKQLWLGIYSVNGDRDLITNYPERDLWGSLIFFSTDMSRLTVNGQILGCIESLSSIGDITRDLSDPTDLLASLQSVVEEWEKWALDSLAFLIGFQPISSLKKWATNEFIFALLRQNLAESYTAYQEWRDYAHPVNPYISEEETSNKPPKLRELPQKVQGEMFSLIHGSQMFLTSNAIFGSVTGVSHAQIGDEIWLLRNGLSPFVLSPVTQGYRLLGPCYLKDHMNRAHVGYKISSGTCRG